MELFAVSIAPSNAYHIASQANETSSLAASQEERCVSSLQLLADIATLCTTVTTYLSLVGHLRVTDTIFIQLHK
jgi:hypothetical protein